MTFKNLYTSPLFDQLSLNLLKDLPTLSLQPKVIFPENKYVYPNINMFIGRTNHQNIFSQSIPNTMFLVNYTSFIGSTYTNQINITRDGGTNWPVNTNIGLCDITNVTERDLVQALNSSTTPNILYIYNTSKGYPVELSQTISHLRHYKVR